MIPYYGDFGCTSTNTWTGGTTPTTAAQPCPYCGNFYGNHGYNDIYPSYVSYDLPELELPKWFPPPWRQPAVSRPPLALEPRVRGRLTLRTSRAPCSAASRKQRATRKRRAWVQSLRKAS